MVYIPSRKGKTYEEIFGEEKGKKLREMRSEEMSGDGHHNWKGGISEQWYRKLMAKAQIPAICIDCGSVEKLHIHHKDGNHKNNVIENLEFLCSKCHKKKHPQESYWKGKKLPESTKKKISESLKGHPPNSTSFKKGMVPWWKKQGYTSAKEAIIAKRGHFKRHNDPSG